MANVNYENMVDGKAKNGSFYLECATGALSVGDVVVKTVRPPAREIARSRSTPKTTVLTFVVTGLGGEFYSSVLNCDAVRAYCTRTVEYI